MVTGSSAAQVSRAGLRGKGWLRGIRGVVAHDAEELAHPARDAAWRAAVDVTRSASWATTWRRSMEVLFMGSGQSALPPVVRVSGRAQAELRAGEALSSTGLAWRSVARPPARSACAPPPCSRRNAGRPMCRCRPGTVRRCSPTGGPTRCWSGERSRSTADAALASARSPPRSPPTSGSARRSGASPKATTGKARLRALMLRPAEARQESAGSLARLSENEKFLRQAHLTRRGSTG